MKIQLSAHWQTLSLSISGHIFNGTLKARMLVVNQKSFSNSMSSAKDDDERKLLDAKIASLEAKLAEDERNTVPESKYNDEKKLLDAKIASLEAKLAELRAAPSHNGAINDCLLHVNNVRHGTKEFFEFGANTGVEVNTRVLRELYGWRGHLMDGGYENPSISLHKEFFTPTNIVDLLKKYDVSKELDVLSVDCDIDDFYVTREILVGGYRPRVLINEYNVNFGHEWSVAVKPKPAKAFGYAPVFANPVNLIFVRIDKAEELGLALPSPDIFGSIARALHPDCSGKTWKKIDDQVISKSVDPSISHVEFANGMDEIVLDSITYSSQKTQKDYLQWRVFREKTE
ncbi:hypothetical protein ACHAWO_001211 [Cyclotella atomus]|uniref:Uncharacterized protein n=1 Tax=Cyclotella atomus TaxID=382360 RepID=A0ABD3PAY6_9STRA